LKQAILLTINVAMSVSAAENTVIAMYRALCNSAVGIALDAEPFENCQAKKWAIAARTQAAKCYHAALLKRDRTMIEQASVRRLHDATKALDNASREEALAWQTAEEWVHWASDAADAWAKKEEETEAADWKQAWRDGSFTGLPAVPILKATWMTEPTAEPTDTIWDRFPSHTSRSTVRMDQPNTEHPAVKAAVDWETELFVTHPAKAALEEAKSNHQAELDAVACAVEAWCKFPLSSEHKQIAEKHVARAADAKATMANRQRQYDEAQRG
jgi:hypothetical protein